MKIVIDTNILVRDYLLRGAQFEILGDSIEQAGHALYVPQIVVDETLRRFKEDLQSTARTVRRDAGKLKQFLDGDKIDSLFSVEMDNDWVEARDAEYKEELQEHLRSFSATTLPYPAITHEKLVEKELQRRKPFSDGRGYRDALIWQTIIEFAQGDEDGHTIVLVTENTKDFAGDDGKLHEQLVEDLTNAGLAEDRVVLVESLQALSYNYLKPLFEELENLEEAITAGKYKDVVEEAISLHVQDQLAGEAWDGADFGLHSEVNELSVASVQGIYDVEVNEVRSMGGDKALIELDASCECELEGFVDRSSFWATESDRVHIMDADWNNWTSRITADGSVRVQVTVILNLTDATISSIELNDADPLEEWQAAEYEEYEDEEPEDEGTNEEE